MMATCKIQTIDFLLLLIGQRRHHLCELIYSTLHSSWNWRGSIEKEIQITEWNIKFKKQGNFFFISTLIF